MRIAIIAEGKTETAFKEALNSFLNAHHLAGRMPALRFKNQRGLLPRGDELRRLVRTLLTDPHEQFDGVIALTDVYTGQVRYENAEDARRQLSAAVGVEPRFRACAAQYEFEAWLIPYWNRICDRAGREVARPAGSPEHVNHQKPPARRIAEVYRLGKRVPYVKATEAKQILGAVDLRIAIQECQELKRFINEILLFCEAQPIP